MSQSEAVDVSIIGFNSIVREGICRILSSSEFRNYHFYMNFEQAIGASRKQNIGLAIVDLKNSDDTIHELPLFTTECPRMRVVLMVDRFDFRQMVDAFSLNVYAYLLKEIGAEPLVDCLRLVNCGEKVLPSALLQHLSDTHLFSENKAEVQVHLSELLSDREIDTLRCLVMGYPNKVIAYRLDISEATVKVHVKAILRKLMVQNRTQAAIWAVNQGVMTHSGEFREYRDTVPSELSNLSMISEIPRSATPAARASSF